MCRLCLENRNSHIRGRLVNTHLGKLQEGTIIRRQIKFMGRFKTAPALGLMIIKFNSFSDKRFVIKIELFFFLLKPRTFKLCYKTIISELRP